jgi:uncharacterized protein YyaL (SSP411 family)
MLIVRGKANKMAVWREKINQTYMPHHLFFYLDGNAKDLPPTLQRNCSDDVNAWVCKGVICGSSMNDLQEVLKTL